MYIIYGLSMTRVNTGWTRLTGINIGHGHTTIILQKDLLVQCLVIKLMYFVGKHALNVWEIFVLKLTARR